MDTPKQLPISRSSMESVIGLLNARVSSAPSERADWTFVAVLSSAYVDSLHRFLSVGTSDRVQVLGLHGLGASTRVHRVLPDQNSSHAPSGRCRSGGTRCDGVPVSPAELSLTKSSRSSEEMLGRRCPYVQLPFPAHHHQLTMRGHASESSVSMNRGGGQVTAPQLADLLAHFAARRRGKKFEVLNLGMCQTASTDGHVLAG